MRGFLSGSIAACALLSSPAYAGDQPLTGPIPAWVNPAPDLAYKDVPRSSNTMPRFDEQVLVEGDTVTAYFDVVTYISSAEVLNKVGTISIPWQPAHGSLTVHRIDILRETQTVDALKGGADFTILRREAGLEKLVVDGRLTAVKHLEDLRVGDVLHTTFSLSQRDSVLKGNVQDALLMLPAPLRIGYGRVRLVWPESRKLNWKPLMPGVTANVTQIKGNFNELSIALPVGKIPEMPKNIPVRLQPLPVIPFSSFADWREVATVMSPLYRTAGAIPAGSDLAKAADAIAARSNDPVQRMADALRLVQDDVRYVLIAMGTGNYVPQTPAETWTKRYGDCKAKTLLLIALLERLGISAEPVLANIKRGDAVVEMPPSAMAFDHVFVRAQIGKESFWLDGTMRGSRLADIRDVPRFGYVLPVFSKDGQLVKLPQRPNARPGPDVEMVFDMSAGPHLPAPYTLKISYAGPTAEEVKIDQGPDYDDRLEKFAAASAKTWTDSEEIGKPRAEYDATSAVWTLSFDGVGYPDWQYREGRYDLALGPLIKVAFDADRGKAAWQAIPALIDKPWTAHSKVTFRLPDGGKGITIEGDQPNTLAYPAANWSRKITRSGGDLIDEISSLETDSEIPAQAISAFGKAVSDAMARQPRVELPAGYPDRWQDVARMQSSAAITKVRAIFDQRIQDKPDDAGRLADRAWLAMRLLEWDAADAYYGKALALDETAARYVDRGKLRAQAGNHAEALKDAQAAFDLESGNDDARNLLASELAETGKVDEAIELLGALPDPATDDGLSAFVKRLAVLEVGNRHKEALAALDAALVKMPSSATLRNMRCWYKGLRNSDLDAALADCNKAIELESDPASFLDSRAMVHYRAGRFKDARQDLEAALAVVPDQGISRFMRGIVLNKLGLPAEGASDIAAARKVYPDVDNFFRHFGIQP